MINFQLRMALTSLLAVVICSALAVADATPEEIGLGALSDRLRNIDSIETSFHQRRQIALLKSPISTSGTLYYLRGAGMEWQINSPYQATIAITQQTIAEMNQSGEIRRRALSDVPSMHYVGKILQALFGGELGQLDGLFAIHPSGTDNHWRIELEPRPMLTRYLQKVSLKGGEWIEQIELVEANGDHTLITLGKSESGSPSGFHLRLLEPERP